MDGRLVPPRDPEALAAAIASLLDNPSLAGALSRAASAGVDEYDWSAVARQVRSTYQHVVGGESIEQ